MPFQFCKFKVPGTYLHWFLFFFLVQVCANLSVICPFFYKMFSLAAKDLWIGRVSCCLETLAVLYLGLIYCISELNDVNP